MSEEPIQNELRVSSLIDNLTDIILEIDLKANVIYVSPQCYDIMGYQPSELVGKKALKYIHPEDVSKIAEAMKEGLQTKKLISVPRYRLLHKNGNSIPVLARGKYVNINGDEGFIVTITDITAQVRIEQKLKESEEKYRLISENANDLISIFNDNLEFEYINERPFLIILGYKDDELIGKKAINFVHPDDRKKILKPFMESNKKIKGTVEARVKHKHGHYITTETNGSTFIDKDGRQKYLVIARDISERKRAEEIIIEENKKLMELSQIKSELVTKASHELKTPLSSIYGASQFLLKNYKEEFNQKALGFIEMIYRGSQRLRYLIENLLDVSRVESGKLILNIHEENLVEIIHECSNDLKYWADKKNIKVLIEVPGKLLLIVDRIRIEQVITNLLSNAIKYTPPNNNIYVTLNESEQWIDITIRDTGVGLTKKEEQLLFQKFGKISRVSENLNLENEGSGLGLYISKEIVELHKGKILVESKGRNKGSKFTIRLPRSN